MFELKTFAEATRPTLLLNMVFGTGSVAPFKNNGANKVAEIVYLFASLAMFNYLSYVQYLYKEFIVPQNIIVNYTFAFIWWLTTYSTITILIIVTKFQTKSRRELFDDVEKIDDEMETVGLPRQHWAHFKYQMFHLCLWMCQFATYTSLNWILKVKPTAPTKQKIILSVAVHIVPHMIISVQLLFTVCVRYIGTKFRQLNELLEKMIEALDLPKGERFLEGSDDRSIQHDRTMNDLRGNVEIIMKARKYHLELIELARRTNKFFGLRLLLLAVTTFVTLMLVLYKFNCFLWHSSINTEGSLEAFYMLVDVVTISSRIVHLYVNCMHTCNQAKAAGFLLCRLYDSSTSTKFRAEVQNFTQQVLRNPLVFTICGLVDFDRLFLPSMAGSVFAYLFVIVQLMSTQWYFRQESAANATDLNVTLAMET